MALTEEMAIQAKNASIKLSAIPLEIKNKALYEIYKSIKTRTSEIILANKKDIGISEKNNLASPLIKRLRLDENKINEVLNGIKSLIDLEDPVGITISATELDKGLELYKVSCPIGVIGVIFESRPDALVQIATLCLKSGNSVLLKGGSEAANTNLILSDIIAKSTNIAGIPDGWIQLLESRSDVNEMLKMDEYIDLIIPRGSNEFVKYIMDNSRIAVLGHAEGICHLYIDDAADLDIAVSVSLDSKAQYVAVCNAVETILVNEDIADSFLPRLNEIFLKNHIEIRGCKKTQKLINVKSATEEDWSKEYLDYIISVKVVTNIEEAINHINNYGSKHTDGIITKNKNNAIKFMNLVDSANVLLNCSTRFSDGFRYGLGAEVGISTNKIHARGPVGLEGLVIYKWKLIGSGQIVGDYSSGKTKFTHRKLNKKFKL